MKIIVLTNSGMGLYKFRKELLEELISRGNEVYISLPYDEYITKLEKISCKFIETYIDRRGINPIKDFKLLFFYLKTLKHIRPDIVLTYTIKPNIYGGIACRISNVSYIANITGLGSSIESRGFLKNITLFLYKIALKQAACVFFQNESNRLLFSTKKIIKSKYILIPGSGVNLEYHKFEPYPEHDGMINFLFIGRIMKEKGIDELLEAAKRIKEHYFNVQFDIVGGIEEDYTEKLLKYEKLGIIKYHGQQDDVHSFIKKAHAVILPSYHEGISNVLLEAASTGRPVLASRVPGCIETFDEGISGYSFEVKNIDSLVEAIVKFIELPYEKKKNMGIAGRKKIEKEFDRNIVINAYLKEINRITKYNGGEYNESI
ncbi:glycosyltransferase family 4 protein [Thermoanaerobacterium butyriciformans]|uniref:Galacturonosyltransferase n=1 Tax=Thermoanaerobacterium butyriciformans TaxID=1702242 RepID=A0ABS4NAJ2_9THEO|nr:glycosyltransferase family 4 protein [Thermoanaerobacterium butyriciformans]MBP2070681.1 galacturonosyltransferase [Thermoanaerobacterium butyriciformans]